MKRFLLMAGVCLATVFAAADITRAQADFCPPCYKDRAPMTSDTRAHQLPRDPNCSCSSNVCGGCAGDNRQVIRVRFDTDPNATWVTGRFPNYETMPGGGYIVEPAIYHATTCAIAEWNTKRGTNGDSVPYLFVIDQESTNAHIIIRREQPPNAPYASISATPAPPYYMKLTPDMSGDNWAPAERCGTIKHEIGHPLNAANNSGPDGACTTPGNTIMSGHDWRGYRYTNTIFTRDVDAVHRNFLNRETCKGSYTGDAGEQEEGPGDGDPCNGDPYCGDPCQGDPYCGDPCGGDPYCGDPCQGDPDCGCEWIEFCTQVCFTQTYCGAYNECTNECMYYQTYEDCGPQSCEWDCV